MSSDNPFVGLRSFESDESLLFFGRQEQTLELLQRLHLHHFVAVTGGSGSGKSSLIKAGLIPRLKAGYLVNDNDRWAISVMKPGQSPIRNLADALLNGVDHANDLTGIALEQKINKEGADAIMDILQPLFENGANFLLLVDQFEELFRFFLNQKDTGKKDEVIDFVNIMLELSAQKSLPIYVVMTMRSDFIGDCSQFYGLPEAMNESQYIVPRLNRVQLRNTIEGPVRLYKGSINPALTARLLNDAQLVKDELPLLQHCLMRIWDRDKHANSNGELDLDDYEAVGGIEKALSNHADEAIQGMSQAELLLTKRIFQALTIIDENGRKIRRPARLSELELITGADSKTLLSIINRFIEGNRSFLIINKVEGKEDYLIDISHESLIRQWNILGTWVDEEAESGKIFKRLTESTALHKENKKNLLVGNELHQVLQWYYSFQPSMVWAQRYSPNFKNSIEYLKKSEREEKKQRQRKVRTRALLAIAAILVIIIISWFAVLTYKNNIKNKEQLALNYWNNSQAAKAANNYLDALHLISRSVAETNNKTLTQDLLIDAEASLPRTALKNIFVQNDVINGVAFSADGTRILEASNDGSARIFDKITGKQTGPGMKHGSPVFNAVFSPDNKSILTVCSDKTARIWDAATGNQMHSFAHGGNVRSAVFSPDGKLVLTGSEDGYARLWQVATEKLVDSFKHRWGVNNAVFSPDGTEILTACNEFFFSLWKLPKRNRINFPGVGFGLRNVIFNAVFSHDGRKILTISTDSAVRIWDTSGRAILFKHTSGVIDAVFSPDDKLLLTASVDKSACLWDIETQSRIGTVMKHEGPVYSVAFSADGTQVLTAGFDKTIRLWDIGTMAIEKKENIFKHMGIVTSGVFSPDGTKILTASYDATARVWDAVTKKQIRSLQHLGIVNTAVFSSDGKWILTASRDKTARLWDVATGKQIGAVMEHPDGVTSAAFSPDNKLILTTGLGSDVWIWEAGTGRQLTSFEHEGNVSKAVFSPDGKSILIASDSSAFLLDAVSKKQVGSFKHDNVIYDVSFSADGKWILTASWDKTARLWDVATKKQIGPAMKHNSYVNSAVCERNGNWILTGAWDNAAHVWSTITFKEIGPSKKHESAITSAVFSPDSKWILTAGYDSTARLWEMEGDLDISADLFKLQAQATTGVEYYVETSETECISPEEWKVLKEKYYSQALEHYKTCKYPQYNLWRRFYPDEAKKIKP